MLLPRAFVEAHGPAEDQVEAYWVGGAPCSRCRFEERYQLPSERLAEAFTRLDWSLDETDFHAWGSTWASYQILTGR